MKTNLKTLRKHLPYIANSFIYPYNKEGTTKLGYLIELRMVMGISRTLREELCFISSSNPLKQHAKQTKKKHTPMQHKDIEVCKIMIYLLLKLTETEVDGLLWE